MKRKQFIQTVNEYYRQNGRTLPWRTTNDPYSILISEIMLQQTQVDRVVPKYTSWLKQFPNTTALASAPLTDILNEWQGLGYNRRALYLKNTALKIEQEFGGEMPKDEKDLLTLAGIGVYTARAIQAFAWNIPNVLVETNIRTVYMHHFFKDREKVSDKELEPVIEETLDHKNPREWYWALMDYGSHLKKTVGNASKRSKHYTKQSTFEGSNRQIRAQILTHILEKGETTQGSIRKAINDERTLGNLQALLGEGFLEKNGKKIMVKKK